MTTLPKPRSAEMKLKQSSVKWNNHLDNLQHTFPKLLANGQFSDVTFACEGKLIKLP